MPACTCLCVAHTCFSLSVIVVFLFAPDSLGLCTYCTKFVFFCCNVQMNATVVFFLSCIFSLFIYLLLSINLRLGILPSSHLNQK